MGNGWRCTERRWKYSRRAGTDGSKPRSARGVATYGWAGMTASGLTSQQLLLMLALEVQRGHVVEHQRRAAVLDGVAGSRPRPAGRDSPTRRPAQALVHRGPVRRCDAPISSNSGTVQHRGRLHQPSENGLEEPLSVDHIEPQLRPRHPNNLDQHRRSAARDHRWLHRYRVAEVKHRLVWSAEPFTAGGHQRRAHSPEEPIKTSPSATSQATTHTTRATTAVTHGEGKGAGRLGNVKPQHFVAIAHGCSSRV